MNKIGIKFLDSMTFEQFESLQYLLTYSFEYEDLNSYISEEKIIELDIDDEEVEDREDDLLVLESFLMEFDNQKIRYELYAYDNEWERKELNQLS